MRIRLAADDDAPELARVCLASVRTLGPRAYTDEQVEAWASVASDVEFFRKVLLVPATYLAEDTTGAVGFAGLAPDGHIPSLYVHPDRTREGVATRLLRELLRHAQAEGIRPVHTEASEFSRALFERLGFAFRTLEFVDRLGVSIPRYRMRWPA